MNDVLQYIPKGRENAITRSELCRLTGNNDRKNRKHIEELRRQGHIICNDQEGKGYFIPEEGDLKSIKRQYDRNHHRAMAILVQQKHLRKLLKEGGNNSDS